MSSRDKRMSTLCSSWFEEGEIAMRIKYEWLILQNRCLLALACNNICSGRQ